MHKDNLFYIKAVLFAIALLDYMGFTIAATVFPELLINPATNMLPETVSYATRLSIIGIALGLYPLGQFLSASILGELSDVWGRRKILLLTVAGTLIATICAAVSIYFASIILLLLSRFLLGLFAGNVSVAQASIIDISDAKTKASNISLIQLSLGLAWVFGAPIGSFLSNSNFVSWFDYSTPFWVLAGALTVVFLTLCFTFKETIKEFRTKSNIHPLKGVQLTYQALTIPKYRRVFLIWMVFIAGWALFSQFLPTFLLLNFNYTVTTIGPMLAFMGGTFACTQIFIARGVLKVIPAEKILAYVMVVPGFAALSMTVVKGWLQLHTAAFLFPFAMGFTLPALLTTISNLGPGSEQGILLGRAQSIQALATIIVTLAGGHLLALNKLATSIVGGLMMLSAWLYFIFYQNVKAKQMIVNAKFNRKKTPH